MFRASTTWFVERDVFNGCWYGKGVTIFSRIVTTTQLGYKKWWREAENKWRVLLYVGNYNDILSFCNRQVILSYLRCISHRSRHADVSGKYLPIGNICDSFSQHLQQTYCMFPVVTLWKTSWMRMWRVVIIIVLMIGEHVNDLVGFLNGHDMLMYATL